VPAPSTPATTGSAVPVAALALVDVAEVHARRLDLDQHLALARPRLGHVLQLQHLRPAGLRDHDRAQDVSRA
jgi:hypothetical protein